MKHRVKILGDSSAQYSVKLWRADDPEPEGWDLQTEEDSEDILQGGALIIAHYTVVTFLYENTGHWYYIYSSRLFKFWSSGSVRRRGINLAV